MEITKEHILALGMVIDYLWDDEKKHWELSQEPDKHIFQFLKSLQEIYEFWNEGE